MKRMFSVVAAVLVVSELSGCVTTYYPQNMGKSLTIDVPADIDPLTCEAPSKYGTNGGILQAGHHQSDLHLIEGKKEFSLFPLSNGRSIYQHYIAVDEDGIVNEKSFFGDVSNTTRRFKLLEASFGNCCIKKVKILNDREIKELNSVIESKRQNEQLLLNERMLMQEKNMLAHQKLMKENTKTGTRICRDSNNNSLHVRYIGFAEAFVGKKMQIRISECVVPEYNRQCRNFQEQIIWDLYENWKICE